MADEGDGRNTDKRIICSEEAEVRKGPWTLEEDLILINYIATNGEGVWNTVAKAAGLKRTGKSCRLRWLNYLRPDVRRGNITPEEQLLIMDLHARWGNRWSKIARQLPGRTDNEIKNYWRTRIQKKNKPGEPMDHYNNLSPMMLDGASTSQTSGIEGDEQRGYNTTQEPVVNPEPPLPPSFSDESSHSFWAMDDDFWPMHSLNGD